MTFHTNHPAKDMTQGYFADCFFSTPATVELFFLKKPFELGEVITPDGYGHLDLEQLGESDIMIAEPC